MSVPAEPCCPWAAAALAPARTSAPAPHKPMPLDNFIFDSLYLVPLHQTVSDLASFPQPSLHLLKDLRTAVRMSAMGRKRSFAGETQGRPLSCLTRRYGPTVSPGNGGKRSYVSRSLIRAWTA